jgi:hypothetical protein
MVQGSCGEYSFCEPTSLAQDIARCVSLFLNAVRLIGQEQTGYSPV